MTKTNDIFLDMLPSIDLHGFDREGARVATCDFILESKKPKGIIKLVGHVFSFRNLIISFLIFIAFVIWYFFRVRKY